MTALALACNRAKRSGALTESINRLSFRLPNRSLWRVVERENGTSCRSELMALRDSNKHYRPNYALKKQMFWHSKHANKFGLSGFHPARNL